MWELETRSMRSPGTSESGDRRATVGSDGNGRRGLDGGSDSVNGFGLTAGFGYEFADLWLIDAAVTYGRPSESGESLSMFDIRAGISILSH